MVRSTTSSCFKIITCSSESVEDDDDRERVERKGSTDKRRWSFRKSSDRHQMLNNPVMSETPSTENKDNQESTNVVFNEHSYRAVPEKISVPEWENDPKPVSDAVNLKASEPIITTESASKDEPTIPTESESKTDSSTIMNNASKTDNSLEDSVVIIQAAIRGYLSQRAFLKHKNIIKLQAAFRGLLVRRQAVGTLRCVQAIIKMQVLVRARRARMALEGSLIEEKIDEEHDQSVKLQARGISGTKMNSNYSSAEKLLGNGFARQLLESMPKKKPIRVRCDPLRPDSAWKWLERWVSVSSSDFAQPQKPVSNTTIEEQVETTGGSTIPLGTEAEAEALSESADIELNIREAETATEIQENVTAYDANSFQFEFCTPSSSKAENDAEQPSSVDVALSETEKNSSNTDTNQNKVYEDGASDEMLDLILSRPEADSEPPKHSMKRAASEQPEIEGKKIVVGSKKVCNPAFAAAQSKFEVLSSASTAGRSIASTHHDIVVEPKLDNLALSAEADTLTNSKGLIPTDDSFSHDQRNHNVDYECGTGFLTSTSPAERSEPVSEQKKNDSEVATEVVSDLNMNKDYSSNLRNLDDKAREEFPSSPTNVSYPVPIQSGKLGYDNGKAIDSIDADAEVVESLVYANGVVPLDSVYSNGDAVDSVYTNGETVDSALATNSEVYHQSERNAPNVQVQLNNTENQQAYRSPDGSPRSRITASESHGTPSSLLLVGAKKKKSTKSKSDPSKRRKPQSESKKSPSNANHDSGGRNSSEQVEKDSKNGKRRNSLGLAKLDYGDHESRDSSSNSLPSYMQATQSAKAKVHANNSPRSSPDVQDNEHFIKKRHSLPNANGKQGSPRVQSTTPPQAQQGAKGQRWQR